MTAPAPLRSPFTRAQIIEHGNALPAAPRILAKLCELLRDANTELDEIAVEVRADPALAARVLRVANSVAFSGGREIETIDEALARVGFGQVLSLVGAASVKSFSRVESLRLYGLEMDCVHESMLFHAVAAEEIAHRAGDDAHLAYTAGLLRIVGMVVLDGLAGNVAPADAFPASGAATYDQFEQSRFGITSVVASRMLVDEWHLPETVVSGVERQYLLQPDDVEDRLACVLNLAGCLVARAGFALPGEVAHWQPKEDVLQALDFDESRLDASMAAAMSSFERVRQSL